MSDEPIRPMPGFDSRQYYAQIQQREQERVERERDFKLLDMICAKYDMKALTHEADMQLSYDIRQRSEQKQELERYRKEIAAEYDALQEQYRNDVEILAEVELFAKAAEATGLTSTLTAILAASICHMIRKGATELHRPEFVESEIAALRKWIRSLQGLIEMKEREISENHRVIAKLHRALTEKEATDG